ncbi:MAG: hypothetical protein K8T10_14070 [Candidatus Eremiobacteraeota bacterium]|nr:hypothetical protein [Candidatus Eremiobacteraeota bacterium]
MKIKAAIAVTTLMILIMTSLFIGCKAEIPEDYFPIGVGSHWEYLVYSVNQQGDSQISKDILMVTGKEMIDDLECYKLDKFSLEGGINPSWNHYREYLAKTEEGISCTKRAFPLPVLKQSMAEWELRNSPAEPRFKTKLKEGDSWEWEGFVTLFVDKPKKKGQKPRNARTVVKQIRGTIKYEYKGKEQITVMNKKLNCIKIFSRVISEDKQEIERKLWYAPNIGLAREEAVYYRGSEVTKSWLELVDYNITNRELFKAK